MRTKILHIITSIAFFYSSSAFSQAPNLASAAPFALFTAVGAFDNIGFTVITGDIGTNSGAFNGFPPGTVAGQIHVADPVATQAAMDVEAAYNTLGFAVCGFLVAPGLGNNQIITPGVTCSGAASVLNGILIFDGQGNPNAEFIIKIDGALTTGSFSSISLINGAQLKNIYWRINGRVDLGENSTFKGTILANGALNLMLNASLEGRGLSRAGAITLDNNTVSNSLAILPVNLISFSATRQGLGSILKWSTATEQNSRDFTIERKSNIPGASFINLGTIAAAGNSSSISNYTMTDNTPNPGANFYRLRSTDIDGRYTLSSVKVVWFNQSDAKEINIFPNPAKSNFMVTGAEAGSRLILMDVMGKNLIVQSADGNGNDQVETSNLPAGIYFLKVISLDGTSKTIKVIKD